MKNGAAKKRGIFIKVFTYTLLFVFLMIAVAAVFFAGQFLSFYRRSQIDQLSRALQPILDRTEGQAPEQIIGIARQFHERNQSFSFLIEDADRNVLYSTFSAPFPPPPLVSPDSRLAPSPPPENGILDALGRNYQIVFRINRAGEQYTLRASTGPFFVSRTVRMLVRRILAALALMLVLCALGAAFFARMITRPIMRLAADTKRMSALEEIPAPAVRNDEIGQLARDIYAMYGALKRTIADLEQEVEQERAMEDSQRAFFSAASHELKTPIAAAGAMVEGMLANIGEYRDHRKYLRECLRTLNAQNRLVSEILEIVNLSEGRREVSFQAVDLAELLASLIDEYGPIAEQRGQRILNRAGKTRVRADRKLLGQALSNVLGNALQNSPEGESVQIWDEAGPDSPGTIRLNIFNPKARIEEESPSRLFEPFYRRDRARNREAGRSGLGLAIVKRALEGMAVPFALQNRDGGVLFWMDLPEAGG
ncbi:MAG: HAMP domain-containing histidine kinase [Treponema sp.]|jgi:two-component system sensor histidine kinase VanS|nr:HAMP domain-containing histidine kinase [Treponema sp.]